MSISLKLKIQSNSVMPLGGGLEKWTTISVTRDLRYLFLKSKNWKLDQILLFSDEETEAQISSGTVSVGLKLWSWASIEEFGVPFFFDSVQKQMGWWSDEPSLAQAWNRRGPKAIANEKQPSFQQHGRKGTVTDLKAILSLKLWSLHNKLTFKYKNKSPEGEKSCSYFPH